MFKACILKQGSYIQNYHSIISPITHLLVHQAPMPPLSSLLLWLHFLVLLQVSVVCYKQEHQTVPQEHSPL